MPTLSVLCRGCFRYFPVDAQLAGQNTFCPNCNAVVSVPIPMVDPNKPLPLHAPSNETPILAQVVAGRGSPAWRTLNRPLGCGAVAMLAGFAALVFMCCGGFVGGPTKAPPAGQRVQDPIRPEPQQVYAGDLRRLQGTWKQVNGHKTWMYVIAGNRLAEYSGYRAPHGGIKLSEGDLTIDESTSPKQISWHGNNQGIYKLEGNRLTVCFAMDGRPGKRPRVFADDPDRAINVWIFERSR